MLLPEASMRDAQSTSVVARLARMPRETMRARAQLLEALSALHGLHLLLRCRSDACSGSPERKFVHERPRGTDGRGT